MAETMIDTGARRIFAHAEVADPTLPWMVFSNSLLTDTTLWEAQVRALEGRVNLLRYDQQGHGRSPADNERITMPELADDLIAVIDRFGLRDVIFCGVSMGVPTGLAACARRPELFGRMILINGQVQSSPDGPEVWAARVDAARGPAFGGFCDAMMRRWLAPEVADSERGARLLAMMQATPFQGFESCALALATFDSRPGLAAVRGPVLAVAGRNDVALTAHMTEVFGARPGVQFEVIEGAGHLANYEAPEAFNRLMTAFLDI